MVRALASVIEQAPSYAPARPAGRPRDLVLVAHMRPPSRARSTASSPSGDDLERTREARSEHVLHSHVEQARGLELAGALLRADADRVEPAIARECGDVALGILIVAGDEHVESLTGECAL